MPVTRDQLLAHPRSGARPLNPAVRQPAAAAGRAAPATRPGQVSAQRCGVGVAAHPQPQRADANGSMWRLRSLIAMGHTTGRIAAALGTTTSTIGPLVTGNRGTVPVPLRDDITALFDAWWDKHPPQATPADKAAAVRALGDAAVRNWPCPAALNEDELDTPGYQPADRWRYSKGTGPAAEDPLGKQRDLAGTQRPADLAAVPAERDAAEGGWRIRQPRHQAHAEAEPEAV
jgi:hypothetical protein